ncbi:SIR2 family protein [Tritonibacter mobilis]|uniref:Uncharacterized protein n=1 Tax=Tritonibacter mobilis F1926 TaxID=1265309 RepID=A0A1B1A6K0_9RHOB|nr:SIR2 family protein [Tritonibacter mobilis]ANP42192.1 hypothetical protein K529_015540 [Tritonibacter mobilis F1926]KJZ22294.1 hypothetical protein TW79_18880 [Tritonibacter mobilis]
MDYEEYKEHLRADIAAQIEKLCCQPVLFVGAGLSRRYFNAPSWTELLQQLANECPLIDKSYAYYAQSCESPPQIGSIFAEKYREWAWGTGENNFPKELFDADAPADSFLKHAISSIIKEKTPDHLSDIDENWFKEISALQQIKPHAVLTTNYDTFLEKTFPNHTVIVGQSALKGMPFTVGEIFKIHGCVDEISEVIITQEDYDKFHKKKKFIAARLLSLFNEHPMLIVGYGASDPNVRAILSDIDEALALPGSLIDNIYFIEYDPEAEKKTSYASEKLIQIEENRSVRVKLIVTSDFEWVFDAFKSPDALSSIPANLMRAILARSYELSRTDTPKTKLEVDFQFLEGKLENQEEFAKLLGITTIHDASKTALHFPYSITELGQLLGGNSWHKADQLMKIVLRDTGFDMKASDTKFQQSNKVNKTVFHKYSEHALELLKKVETHQKCDPQWLD